ncbi:MAG TPA: monovalent cation/H+ antiporter complex subunit F [Thermomicrobiales bacterium]|nr:monovalent cation/H+ antiporter complex subunit F [Thermomicrobiales bacterium]
MHEIVYYIATVWMTGLLCVCLVMVVRAKSALTRILALDAVTLVLVALLVIYSATTGKGYYIDAAILLALLSFISTVAAARYHSERRIF